MILALLALSAISQPAPVRTPVTTLEATSQVSPAPPAAGDQLPLGTLADDRLTVAVNLGDHGPFRFLVDTGADRTAVSRQLAARLSLPPGRGARLHSVTGMSQVRTASVRGLRVAERAFPTVTAPLLDAEHVGADGILGTDVLRSAQVRFDFKAGVLSISGPGARRVRSAEPETIVVEARRRAGRLIVTEAIADGQRLTVVLDTGSAVTIGNAALRRALGRRGLLKEDRPIELTSVTGEKLPATYMFLDQVEVGGVTLRGLGIAIADAHTFRQMDLEDRPALLLGMNAMRAFDSVTIDLAAKKLRFSLPSGQARRAGLFHAR